MFDFMISDKLWNRPNARWVALLAYLIGWFLIGIGYRLPQGWSIYLMMGGLVIWIVPVSWCAYRFSKS